MTKRELLHLLVKFPVVLLGFSNLLQDELANRKFWFLITESRALNYKILAGVAHASQLGLLEQSYEVEVPFVRDHSYPRLCQLAKGVVVYILE
jgi:hypothetical protein